MKVLFFFLAFILLLGTCVRAQRSVKDDGFAVRTTVAQGELEGIQSTVTDVVHYLGVPFAAPPVGDLRWRAPQPPAGWEGVRQAKNFGPRPVQKFLFADMRFRSDGMSEDCLYLNVWAPARSLDRPLPILLYFHGGGNVAGSGDELRYDGETLARQGIIVVTANYRLGVFGFLAHPELTAEAGSSGNYGLLDQVAALDWVRANAAAFGGDPDRITIGGESAGSMDCSMLMASPLSRDKIAGVLGQSGSAMLDGLEPWTLEKGEEVGKEFMSASGKSSLAELRAAPTSLIYNTVYKKPGGISFDFVVDGHFLTEMPVETFAAGRQAKIPLMIGWTSTEVAWASAPESAEAYVTGVHAQFGKEKAEKILPLYPADDFVASNTALQSDNWIVLSTWKWADLHARTGNAPVYRYQFDRVRPALVGETREQEPPGAGHATDIEYFFNTLAKSDAYAWEEADQTVATQMSAYLASFVRSGRPHGEHLTNWSAIAPGAKAPIVLFLNERSAARPAKNDDRYRMLEGLK